jgi:hypothetical protein
MRGRIRSVCIGQSTLHIYSDPAYRASFGVMCLFEHPRGRHYLTPKKQAFNKALAQVHIFVENAFGAVLPIVILP